MNVLLLYPEIKPTFFSFPRILKILGKNGMLPPLGLITLAAMLPEDWNLRLVDLNIRKTEESDWIWADLVMISGVHLQRDNMVNLIREGKRRKKPVIVGGPFPTAEPEESLNAGCDLLVRGEAETIIDQLLDAVNNGLNGQVLFSEKKVDMKLAPHPRYDLLDIYNYSALSVQTTRGCPYNCEFCDITNLYGGIIRHKPVEKVMAELDSLYGLGWNGSTLICDDNFIGDRKYAKELLDKLILWSKSHGEPFGFWGQASVDLGKDQEMMDLMTEANFSLLVMGVESLEEKVLDRTNKRQNIKTPLVESIQNLGASGLDLMASFIIGLDQESPGADERIAAFVEKTQVPFVVVNMLNVLPNTRLHTRMIKEGRLLESVKSGDSFFPPINFIPARPTREVVEEYMRAWEKIYEPKAFMKRTTGHYLRMRPTRKALAGKNDQGQPEYKPAEKRKVANRSAREVASSGLHAIWYQIFRSNLGWLFWKNLLLIIRKNPSRRNRFIDSSMLGEEMIGFTHLISQKCRAFLSQLRNEA